MGKDGIQGRYQSSFRVGFIVKDKDRKRAVGNE